MRNRKFEAWFAKQSNLPLTDVQQMWKGKTYQSYRYFIELAYDAWCAALGFIHDVGEEGEA